MKRGLATIYAIFCTLLMTAGFLLVLFFAWQRGTTVTLAAICGLIIGFIFAPIVHEVGHLFFGKINGMQCVYIKCFCFKFYRKGGKLRFAFASPFSADQTQMIPKASGNMQKRASAYTLGGLYFSGGFLLFVVVVCILFHFLWRDNFVAIGVLPYAAYLFLLNVVPAQYVGGNTDTLVYRGIKKGTDGEKCMLSAMEIHGQLFEGKSFGEIDERYYFDLPQLCEEESLYAVLLDLRYRYYLDKEELESAADCLNRLAQAQAYLSDEEVEKIAAELVYMHSLNGNLEEAEECGKLCREFLSSDRATAKRILAAYSFAFGKKEAVADLLAQGEAALSQEEMLGVQKFEKTLLQRIKMD